MMEEAKLIGKISKRDNNDYVGAFTATINALSQQVRDAVIKTRRGWASFLNADYCVFVPLHRAQ